MSTQRQTDGDTHTLECSSASKKDSLTFKRGNMKTSHQRISQCSSDWPQTHYLDEVGLALRAPPASVSGIKGMCHHRAAQQLLLLLYLASLLFTLYSLSSLSVSTMSLGWYAVNPLYISTQRQIFHHYYQFCLPISSVQKCFCLSTLKISTHVSASFPHIEVNSLKT